MEILISNSSQKPIYTQIADQIRKHILTGRLKDGDTMPSIRALAKELHVSVITTKTAYQELEREGLLEAVKGKGFYVSAKQGEALKEQKNVQIKKGLQEIIEESKALGISLEELIDLVKRMYS
ncbi:transcriptional regulator, GntR family [Natronincola peptidivorans]|uniref:Transcriptional regulator, GntR family n=1 Tax=Natronincola peptidivorans TaxID=426128 RepID=A0A1I0F1W3_9FIRM|nr:GntR family transcriptional regulator [Natronincola peptidivorans]SET51998.1 transcriptional regulator, GntR family [Natronincola peptidivorans]